MREWTTRRQRGRGEVGRDSSEGGKRVKDYLEMLLNLFVLSLLCHVFV